MQYGMLCATMMMLEPFAHSAKTYRLRKEYSDDGTGLISRLLLFSVSGNEYVGTALESVGRFANSTQHLAQCACKFMRSTLANS